MKVDESGYRPGERGGYAFLCDFPQKYLYAGGLYSKISPGSKHNFAGAKHVFEKFHLLFVQCLLLVVSLCGKYSCVYLRMVVWNYCKNFKAEVHCK